MPKVLLLNALVLLLACSNGWCAHLNPAAQLGLQWRTPNHNSYNTQSDSLRHQKRPPLPKLDSAQLAVQQAAQSRRLGWYAVATAFAGLGSGVVFALMPLLLLPVAALLGIAAIRKGKPFRKSKPKGGYKLGWLGLVLSAVFLGIVAILIARN